MSDTAAIAADDRIRLTTGVRLQVDQLTHEPMLLYPEGLIKLNPTGAAILRLCDGHRSVREIAGELSQQFDAPLEVLQADVAEYLVRLRATGVIVVNAGEERPT